MKAKQFVIYMQTSLLNRIIVTAWLLMEIFVSLFVGKTLVIMPRWLTFLFYRMKERKKEEEI